MLALFDRFCFVRLKLLLFAVMHQRAPPSSKLASRIVLNPGSDVIVDSTTKGFFIGQSEDEAKRALYYCARCHGKEEDPDKIRRCLCYEISEWRTSVTLV